MRAALICPGPSLEGVKTADLAGCELRVGVNRAAERFPCDVWAFLDPAAFLRFRPGGRPRILTTRVAHERLATPKHRGRLDFHGCELLEHEGPDASFPEMRDAPWTCFSGLMALAWLAHHPDVTEVQTFGVDLGGSTDYRGEDGGESRSPHRWQNEHVGWFFITQRMQRMDPPTEVIQPPHLSRPPAQEQPHGTE